MTTRKFKLVAGGQTGADRAALDWSIAHGIPHGGWCPRGRRAEDGVIPPRYRLKETGSPAYAVRTRWNVRDSEATIIFAIGSRLTGGTLHTARVARALHKPLLRIAKARTSPRQSALQLDAFLRDVRPCTLNVAGPRASEAPEIGAFVWEVLSHSAVLRRFGAIS